MRIPKYRKHSSGGAYVERLGKRIYLPGKYGSGQSREAYRRFLAKHVFELANLPDEAATVTVDRLLILWQGDLLRSGLKSEHTHSLGIACLFSQLPHSLSADKFGPIKLAQLRDGMVAKGWSRAYVNDQVQRIKRMFRWGVSLEIVPAATLTALESLRGLRRGRTAASDKQPVRPVCDLYVALAIVHLPSVVADMVRVQRLAGCRPSEVCDMRPGDFDRSGEVWVYTPESHKTWHHGKSRAVFVGPQSQGILAPYMTRDSGTYCFRPCDSEELRGAARHAARKTPLSCGNKPRKKRKRKRPPGAKYNTESYRRAIQRACRKAGIEPWYPNQLRHSAGTLIRAQFGLEAAQVILGHSRADVTQVYAERDLAKGIEVAKRMG